MTFKISIWINTKTLKSNKTLFTVEHTAEPKKWSVSPINVALTVYQFVAI